MVENSKISSINVFKNGSLEGSRDILSRIDSAASKTDNFDRLFNDNLNLNWLSNFLKKSLLFEAVNYKSEIWLNDQVVGFHEGGYSPFKFRVDKLAKLGKENTLIVRDLWILY